MIAILDYGVGNLFSLRSSLAHLGLDAVVRLPLAQHFASTAHGNPAQLSE